MSNKDQHDDVGVNPIVKSIVYAVRQIGFPAVSTIITAGLCFYVLHQTTVAINSNTQALVKLAEHSDAFQKAVIDTHNKMLLDLSALRDVRPGRL